MPAQAFEYPIGSVIFLANNLDPNTLYIGTWQRLNPGFIAQCFPGEFAGEYTPEQSVGTTEVQVTGHTLTLDEIPSHRHDVSLETSQDGGHTPQLRPEDSSYHPSCHIHAGSGTTPSLSGGFGGNIDEDAYHTTPSFADWSAMGVTTSTALTYSGWHTHGFREVPDHTHTVTGKTAFRGGDGSHTHGAYIANTDLPHTSLKIWKRIA